MQPSEEVGAKGIPDKSNSMCKGTEERETKLISVNEI